MTPAITLEELLTWNQESSAFWKAHLEANPALLELPCGIGGAANVQEFVRHIWGVDLVWSQRIAGLPVTDRKEMPAGPLENWDETQTLKYPWLPPEGLTVSRRKMAAHALFHSQRHWAQLATLVRVAGFPSGFKGDLLISQALK